MSANPDTGRPTKTLRYPDFLCIGAQKAGTTWLHKQLGAHPDLWLPPLKEVHYFDVLHLDYNRDPETGLTGIDRTRMDRALRMIEAAAKAGTASQARLKTIHLLSHIGLREHTDAWYGAIFAAAPPAAKCGEITPEYGLLPRGGIEHILRLTPYAKFIFVMRDPIERGWSDLRMVRSRPNAKPSSELNRIQTKDFFARSDYFATIERFRGLVAPENFLTLYFDDIVEGPKALLDRVCGFLGVAFERGEFADLERPVHQGDQAELPPELLEAMKCTLKPAYERLRGLKNPIVENWYQRHFG